MKFVFIFFIAKVAIAGLYQAPDFELISHKAKSVKLSDFKKKTVVLEWYNDGCPFVRKHYDSRNMQKLQAEYAQKGVVWLTIASSAPGKQGYIEGANEAVEKFKEEESNAKYLLLDPQGIVGKKYNAKTTPHMFVLHKGKVVYEGAIDSKPSTNPEDIESSTNYVKESLDAVLSGNIEYKKTKSYGCSVKYKG
jgi:peroxiredoxin